MRQHAALVVLIFLFSMAAFAQDARPEGQQAPPEPAQTAPEAQTKPQENAPEQPGAVPTTDEPLPSAPEPAAIPIIDVYAGYSYMGADPYTLNQQTGLHGWNVALDLNLARWLSLVAEFGGSSGGIDVPVIVPTPFPPCTPLCPPSADTFSASTHMLTYLFGAKLPYRRWEKATPFAQLLFGRAHVSGEALGAKEVDTQLAYSLGLGLDYNVSARFAWRVEGDYLHTKFFGAKQDNYRVSTGIVWKLNHKKKQRTLTTP